MRREREGRGGRKGERRARVGKEEGEEIQRRGEK